MSQSQYVEINSQLELRQIRRYYRSGVIAYTLFCGLIAWIIFLFTRDHRVVYAFCAILIITLCSLVCYARLWPDGNEPSKHLIPALLTSLFVHSLCYSAILWLFIPTGSPEMVMLLVIITTSLAAGLMALTAPFMRGFYATCYPAMLTLSGALVAHGESIYHWLAVSVMSILLGLTWFARALSRTVYRAAELSYQNRSLVAELRSALIQTDEANRAKSVFLASASHDLRQPLHALGLLTETLGGTDMDRQQGELHQHMMSAVDSTRGMLDSLLNISKLDAGAISAKPKPFLLQPMLAKLENQLAPLADEHKLIYRTRDTILAAHSDPLIVELILRNLIANAIRYTDQGGLLVGCRSRAPNKLVIEVWDTGIGIEENKIREIFSEFRQLDNPERDSQKGFGLGLAIAQGLAKTINSEVKVESTLRHGSVFRFELPVSDAQLIEDIPENSAPVTFPGKSVLVIDDDARVCASMKNLLLSWGCDCIAVESAELAVQALGAQAIDIMLVDYRLRGGKTGREAIDLIRAHCGNKVPAIIITGDTATDRIQEAQAVDALLLHKPASTKQLQRMMRKLFA